MVLQFLQNANHGLFHQKLTLYACSVLLNVSLFTFARVPSLHVHTFLAGAAFIHNFRAFIQICNENQSVFTHAPECKLIGTNKGVYNKVSI